MPIKLSCTGKPAAVARSTKTASQANADFVLKQPRSPTTWAVIRYVPSCSTGNSTVELVPSDTVGDVVSGSLGWSVQITVHVKEGGAVRAPVATAVTRARDPGNASSLVRSGGETMVTLALQPPGAPPPPDASAPASTAAPLPPAPDAVEPPSPALKPPLPVEPPLPVGVPPCPPWPALPASWLLGLFWLPAQLPTTTVAATSSAKPASAARTCKPSVL